MARNEKYNSKGDPSDFAPDFEKNPEPYGDPVQKLIDPLRGLPAGTSILDVAGGYGKYAVPFANMGFNVKIVDIHEPSLTEALRRNKTRVHGAGKIETLNADIIRGKQLLGTYDVVFCAGFIHHLDNRGAEDLFDTMVSLTRPGGIVLLEFSTNKDRRLPDGVPILVSGVKEHNLTLEHGTSFLEGLFLKHQLSVADFSVEHLMIRQENFYYDTDMIIASGVVTNGN